MARSMADWIRSHSVMAGGFATQKHKFILPFIMMFLCNRPLSIGSADGPKDTCKLDLLSDDDIKRLVRDKCALVAFSPVNQKLLATLSKLSCIFKHEFEVSIGIFDANKRFDNQNMDNKIKWHDRNDSNDLAFFEKNIEDRACLLPMPKPPLKAVAVSVPRTIPDLIHFLNERCDTYVDPLYGKTLIGYRRDEVLSNLYHVPTEKQHLEIDIKSNTQMPIVANCDIISLPTEENFVKEFLFRSKPVIIRGGIKHWKAISKWSNNYLRSTYGNRDTHVKLTPKGEFEGCDYSENFDNHKIFKIPDVVKSKLLYPELVVVRPATMNMPFSKFIDLVETKRNLSAYLEYTSIPGNFKELQDDIMEPEFLRNLLHLQDLNIWLSDGNTLGKLHFDPFDNLLCQLKGSKQAILFEPHNNSNLYEAHIQEAKLYFDKRTGVFRNHELVDSTSMVMSPINILKPDYLKFPRFQNARPMNCTINEGDILYLPAFWWHEVQSYPSANEKRNLAVNYWYKPFLTKSFPCPECKLDVNRLYRHLLEKY